MDRFTTDQVSVDAALRNPVIDQIARHVSVRSFDSSRPVPGEMVPVIVAAAQSASTSSNFQSWSVVQVTDPERKHQMRVLCNDQGFIDEAPLFLAFCADISRHRWVTERQGYKFGSDYLDLLMISVVDSALACGNAQLAAESMGLGCCMVGAIRDNPREVSDLLELPQRVFATIGLAVGYPASKNEVKPRLPQSVVLHRERYSTEALAQGVAEYDERMAGTGIYDGRRVRVPGVTPEAEEDTGRYGWAEHTARRMIRGNLLRRRLAPFLREKGFSLE
jgi:FMN reductase [NAD(P)H]